jgi:hypothetical protein
MTTGELSELLSNLVLLLRRLPDERISELGHKASPMSEEEVTETVQALLTRLPENYPPAKFSKETGGYWLLVGGTIIYRDVTGLDAIADTANYVIARKGHPTLPTGVIRGIYD